jgi:hypothetical protein
MLPELLSSDYYAPYFKKADSAVTYVAITRGYVHRITVSKTNTELLRYIT